MTSDTNKLGIIGIGSHQGADQAGWLACEQLQSQQWPNEISWRFCRTPAQLPGLMDGFKSVVLIDALLAQQTVGEVIKLAIEDLSDEVHASSTCSSHGFDVKQALALAAVLGQLPKHTYILGINVTEPAMDVGKIVAKALPQLRDEIELIRGEFRGTSD